jgi:hypothetical protein
MIFLQADNVIKMSSDEEMELAEKLIRIRKLMDAVHSHKIQPEPNSCMIPDDLTMRMYNKGSSELWEATIELVQAIDDLAILVKIPFPMDIWRSGRRLFVERSLAFSATVRGQLN